MVRINRTMKTKNIDKAIKSILELIKLGKERTKLCYKFLITIIIKKHFGEKGGHYAILNKAHYYRNYRFGKGYDCRGFYAKGLVRGKITESKDKTLIIDRKTNKYIELDIKFPYDEKYINVKGK